MINESVIEVTATSSPSQTQSGFVVTLEGTNLLLTIILSLAALVAIIIRSVSQFNEITSKIRDLQEDLNSHSNAEGHAQLLQQVKQIQISLIAIERRIDLHLVDYTHEKDSTLLHINGVSDKVKHTWEKTEKILIEQKSEIKEMQKFLNKQQEFKIRE